MALSKKEYINDYRATASTIMMVWGYKSSLENYSLMKTKDKKEKKKQWKQVSCHFHLSYHPYPSLILFIILG